MSKHMKYANLKSNENGMVSIIVTLLFMIILTLIVVGYSMLSRREQRAALDRQLSTQAFYAAESAANDLEASIKNPANNAYYNNLANITRTNCNAPAWPGMNPVLDTSADVRYTCVLYDTRPDDLLYPSVETSKPTIITVTNNNLSSLKINWKGTGENPSFRTSGTFGRFTDKTNWSSETGVLRAMIIPRENINRYRYIEDSFNGYLYPESFGSANTGGTVNYDTGKGPGVSGALVDGNCFADNSSQIDTSDGCNIRITNLPVSSNGFNIVLFSVYTASSVEIKGYDSTNAKVDLLGAQIKIDATGQAFDVIKRIQVRRPINAAAQDLMPLGFTSMEDLCKQIILKPGGSPSVIDNDGCSL